MTKRGRLARIITRILYRRASALSVRGGAYTLYGLAQAQVLMIDNIKHYHKCPQKFDRHKGFNKAKKFYRNGVLQTGWGVQEKRKNCDGCHGIGGVEYDG